MHIIIGHHAIYTRKGMRHTSSLLCLQVECMKWPRTNPQPLYRRYYIGIPSYECNIVARAVNMISKWSIYSSMCWYYTIHAVDTTTYYCRSVPGGTSVHCMHCVGFSMNLSSHTYSRICIIHCPSYSINYKYTYCTCIMCIIGYRSGGWGYDVNHMIRVCARKCFCSPQLLEGALWAN